ncbi:uncharacterized protein LOC122083182 isoform X2 [Macadamia integrifolia]|uniref:uncharacterized protein LOC122083182 isoform X2 n=1 Tax=Macadamia integrifolia TaxID=60698 RepID=UPI001C4FCAB9|nr:uncharacterized protein LOC122083182 isoform X2 [Macadamia integrifolia]
MNFGGLFRDPDGENQHKSSGSSPCAIPALQQVMSATRGATDALSGVGGHVNTTLRRLGAKNIEAGIGCGVGFGHGFGVGLALKPGVMHRVQSCFGQTMASLMMKFGIVPGLQVGQNLLPGSLQSSLGMINETSMQNLVGNIMQSGSKTLEHTSQGFSREGTSNAESKFKDLASKGASVDTLLGTRSEKVVSSFVENTILKEEDVELNELAGRLRSENSVLQMVLKHQQVIEELMEENEKLRQILVEELKVPSSKFQHSSSRTKSRSPCSNCFECRRRQRKLK